MQAATYHQLGKMAQEQKQWEQAKEYFLRTLEINNVYNDTYNVGIVLRSLALLWRRTNDGQLPKYVAPLIGKTPEEVIELFAQGERRE